VASIRKWEVYIQFQSEYLKRKHDLEDLRREDEKKVSKWSCRSSSDLSQDYHSGGPGSCLGQVMWDLWWTKRHCGIMIWGWYTGHLVASVIAESVQLHTKRKKKYENGSWGKRIAGCYECRNEHSESTEARHSLTAERELYSHKGLKYMHLI
jgi:hypothetical protein